MKETFGQRLKRLRKAKGLTQEDIGEKIGTSSRAVNKWENDISSPDISIIISLSDILGVTTDELLGKEENSASVTDKKFDSSKGVTINAEDGEVDLNIKGQVKQRSQSKFLTLFQILDGSLFLLALIAYIIMGVFWTDQYMGWKMGWLSFLVPVIIISFIDAVITKKFHRFAYPVLVTFTYLLLGFLGMYLGFEGWGVYWFLFITIPAFYAIVSPIDHYLGKK